MKRLLAALLLLSLTACGAAASPEPLKTSASSQSDPPPAILLPEPEPAQPRTVDPSLPMVALTFDDGPHPEYTNQILDILEANNSVATFFEVAVNLPAAPEAVCRAADLGCEIGSHSNRHADLGKMSAEAIQADLAAADAAFTEVLGYAPTLLRPPYGSVNKALKSCGRILVTWSVDPTDWKSRDAEKIVEHIQSFESLDGQVILLHSIYDSTVEATETLVPWLLEQGYQLVTVSELISLRFGQTPEADHLYNFDFFRYRLPPLPAAPAKEPVSNLTVAQGDTILQNGSAVTVKLVMTEGEHLAEGAVSPGGGYGAENWTGSCEWQVWRDQELLASCPLTDPDGGDMLFSGINFPLFFSDYNGDGNPEVSVGQWFSSNMNVYELFALDTAGGIQPASSSWNILSSDGKSQGPYSALFEATGSGFTTTIYDNASGADRQVSYLWNEGSGQFLPEV